MKLKGAGILVGLFILLLLAVNSIAADNVKQANRSINDSEWRQLTNDGAFEYRNKVENTNLKKEKQLPIERFILNVLRFFSGTAGKVIIWSLLLAVVAYALWRTLLSEKSMLFSRRKSYEEGEPPVIEDIQDTDWENLSQQAARNGELRQAIRYSYMWLLQLLQQNELIQFRSDKTNYEYLDDLTDTPYKQPFRQLSSQYEYSWYGNFPVAPTAYEAYMHVFTELKKQLR